MEEKREPLSIGIALFDGAEELDWAGPWEVLSYWSRYKSEDNVEVFTVAQDNSRPIPCAKGLRVLADYSWDTPPDIRERGAGVVARQVVLDPARPTWLHVDLDVLDELALPAVTYPQPLGLNWDEFMELVRPLVSAEGLVGVSVADFNPDLDSSGEHARRVIDALATFVCLA